MAGQWTGAVLAGLLIGGVLGVADRTLDDGPPPGEGTTVTEVEVETETTVVTPTDEPTVEATSEQFVVETESGTVVRENTATASAGGG